MGAKMIILSDCLTTSGLTKFKAHYEGLWNPLTPPPQGNPQSLALEDCIPI